PASRPRFRSALPEGCPPGDVGVVDHVAVALDVPVLSSHDEENEVLGVARVRDLPWRLRLDVQEAAWAEDALLSVDLGARLPGVDEVELVLRVVEVVEALVAWRIDDRVHAERGHAERLAHLSEPVALAELLDRSERVSHRLVLSSEQEVGG